MPSKNNFFLVLFLGLASLFFPGTSLQSADEKPELPTGKSSTSKTTGPEPLLLKKSHQPGLHNFIRISQSLYSGGTPESEEAFRKLSELGIKTIVSVDGNRPDVELAEKYGLKYIHIPIGYDGIQEEESNAFIRVEKDCEKPFYFHCHHGKHRGPSAAAIEWIILNHSVEKDQSEKILKEAGTADHYPGLWKIVRNYTIPAQIKNLPELREVCEVDPMVTVMVNIDEKMGEIDSWMSRKENKTEISKERSTENRTPAEVAILLMEDFRETNRNLASDYDKDFSRMLKESENLSQKLHESLKSGNVNLSRERFLSLKKSCSKCHEDYRN